MTSQLHLQYLLYAADGPRTSALINIQCVWSDAKILFSQKKSISGSQSVGRGPQGGTQQLQGRDGGMVVVVGGC